MPAPTSLPAAGLPLSTLDAGLPWWAAGAVLLAAALVALLVGGLVLGSRHESGREAWRAFLPLTALSLLTRALTPGGFLQVDADDVHLVAVARGLAASDGQGSITPALLWLYEAAQSLGPGLSAAFLPARAAGLLLPPLGFLVAWCWWRDRRLATVTGLVLLLDPMLLSWSGAVSAEVPAAAASVAALALALAASARPRRGVLLLPLVAGLYGLAAALRSEWAVLGVLGAMLVVLQPGAASRVGRGIAAAACILGAGLGAWSNVATVAASRVEQLRPGSVLTYLLVGVLLVNPPYLPWKLAALWGLRGPRARAVLPLLAFCAVMLLAYATAVSSQGMHHWRYAHAWVAPFAVAAAPVLLDLWQRRSARRPRLWLAALAASWVFGLVGWGLALGTARNQDARALREAAPLLHQDTLLLYSPTPHDRSPRAVIQAIGGPDAAARAAPLDALWPATCPPAAALRRALEAIERREAERTRRQTSAASPASEDPAACAAALPALRAQLAGRRLAVLVDGLWFEERRFVGTPLETVAPGPDRSLLLAAALDHLVLAEPLPDRARVVPLAAIPHPLDPTADPLWTATPEPAMTHP